VFTAAEVFRWFTELTLLGLSAVELDDVVTVLATAEAEGVGGYETA
jgi:hypothetical protein